MPASHAEIYLHFVWGTMRRLPMLVGAVEQAVLASIAEEAHAAGAEVLAIGGMPDHVHVAARLRATVAPAELMRRVKGVSSTTGRVTAGNRGAFSWQDGYGVFSFSRSHLDQVTAYVRNQKRHHASGKLWEPWETAGPPGSAVGVR